MNCDHRGSLRFSLLAANKPIRLAAHAGGIGGETQKSRRARRNSHGYGGIYTWGFRGGDDMAAGRHKGTVQESAKWKLVQVSNSTSVEESIGRTRCPPVVVLEPNAKLNFII